MRCLKILPGSHCSFGPWRHRLATDGGCQRGWCGARFLGERWGSDGEMSSVQNCQALNKESKQCSKPWLTEKEPHQRWATFFQIKGKQRRDRVAQMADSRCSVAIVRRFCIVSHLFHCFFSYGLDHPHLLVGTSLLGSHFHPRLPLQNPGWLFYVENYTTHFYGDCNKPI